MTQAPQRLPSFDALRRRRDELRRIVAALDDRTLAELLRRAGAPLRPGTTEDKPLEEGAGTAVRDGYPVGGSGESDIHGGRMSDPVGATVSADAGGRLRDPVTGQPATADTWRDPYDPVGQAIEEFVALLSEGLGVLRSVDKRRMFVFSIGDKAHGRQSSLQGDCLACGKGVSGVGSDKLISGYCPACRKAWERADYPDRVRFQRERRRALAEQATREGG